MVRLFVLLLILVCSSYTFGLDLKISSNYSNYFGMNLEDNNKTDPLENNVFNVIDGKTTNGIVISTYISNSRFWLKFDTPRPVDKIAFYSGCQSNMGNYYNYHRVKELTVTAKTNGSSRILIKAEGSLKDSPDCQELFFNNTVIADFWEFEIRSTYGDTNAGRTFLGEIQFWIGPDKYVVTNLESIRKDYQKGFRGAMIDSIKKNLCSAKVVEFSDPPGLMYAKYKEAGLPMGDIEVSFGEGTTVYMEFSVDPENPCGGQIFFGRKGAYFDKVSNENLTGFIYHLVNPVTGGAWKVDEDGVLWIKIGNKEWKKSFDLFSFSNTDLGSVKCMSTLVK